MRNTHWPARVAAGCLVTLSLVGVAFFATLSFLRFRRKHRTLRIME